jgi:outer membrane biosynthesis protein TonB
VYQERQKGLTYSATLHAFVLVLVIFGLPSLLDNKREIEPQAITVELLPISSISNVKPSEKLAEKEKPEEAKTQEKPSPPVKAAEDSTPPPPAEKPAEVKKPKEPDKKAEEKPKDKKDDKKKAKEEDLAAVLKAVRDTAQKDKKEKEKEDGGGKSKSDQYDPTLPLSISEKDAIRSQIAKCWSVPAGAKDAHELIVILRLELAQDGSVIKVELAKDSKSRYASDNFYRAAADSAMRAVKQCSPLQNLPVDKYGTWRDMELTFDPKEMLF